MKFIDKEGREHIRNVGADTIGIHAAQLVLDSDDLFQLSKMPSVFLRQYISIMESRFCDAPQPASPYWPKHFKTEGLYNFIGMTFSNALAVRDPDLMHWSENGSLTYTWHADMYAKQLNPRAAADVTFNLDMLGELFVSHNHEGSNETRCTTIHYTKLREWVLDNGLGYIMFKQEA